MGSVLSVFTIPASAAGDIWFVREWGYPKKSTDSSYFPYSPSHFVPFSASICWEAGRESESWKLWTFAWTPAARERSIEAGRFHTWHMWHACLDGVVYGNFCRKAWYFMGRSMVSCRFSLQSIECLGLVTKAKWFGYLFGVFSCRLFLMTNARSEARLWCFDGVEGTVKYGNNM